MITCMRCVQGMSVNYRQNKKKTTKHGLLSPEILTDQV